MGVAAEPSGPTATTQGASQRVFGITAKVLGVVAFQWLFLSCGSVAAFGFAAGTAALAFWIPFTVLALAWWRASWRENHLAPFVAPLAALPITVLVWVHAMEAWGSELSPYADPQGTWPEFSGAGILAVCALVAVGAYRLASFMTSTLGRERHWIDGALRRAAWLAVAAALLVTVACVIRLQRAQSSVPRVDPATVPVVAKLPPLARDDWGGGQQTDTLPGGVQVSCVQPAPFGSPTFRFGPEHMPRHDYHPDLPLFVRYDARHSVWIAQQVPGESVVLRASDLRAAPVVPGSWFTIAWIAIVASLLFLVGGEVHARRRTRALAVARAGTLDANGWIAFADGTPSVRLDTPKELHLGLLSALSGLQPGPVLVSTPSHAAPFRENARIANSDVHPGGLAEHRTRLRAAQFGAAAAAIALCVICAMPLAVALWFL